MNRRVERWRAKALVALVLATLCSSSQEAISATTALSDWGQYFHDAGRTSFNPDESVLGSSNLGDLKLSWQGISTFAVTAGVLYDAGKSSLRARDPATGSILWSVRAPPHTSVVGATSGLIYVGKGGKWGSLSAFDASTHALV